MDEFLNKKILIVDDEPELLQMIEDILFSEGFFNICTAPDCAKALSLARAQTMALFVLDVNLPDGNGFMLYNELRKISQAPVIFLTARGEPEDRILRFGSWGGRLYRKAVFTERAGASYPGAFKACLSINGKGDRVYSSGKDHRYR